MKSRIAVIIFATSILFSACSTDFEVIGDWKETIVVYGLLDQAQDTQYIKINKAFLGEGNAFSYAQIKDSVQFVNSMNVTIHRIKNGSDIATYTLTPDNSKPKDPGTFYSADQASAIYSFVSIGATALNEDSQYKLVIRNNETGTEATSQTVLVSDFGNLSSPSPSASRFSFILPGNDNFRFAFKFNSAVNARIYQTIVRLHYIDSTSGGNVSKTLDWVSPQLYTQDLDGGELMDFGFVGQDFMRYVGSSIPDVSGLIARRVINADLIVIAAADELNTFINVNRPTSSIVQEKPEYTNISNGLGIFSARYFKDPVTKPLTAATIDTLACGRYTTGLGFLNASGALPCPP